MESEQCHDVYLNLKGKIHYGFGGNLYNALRKKGFKTMMSKEGMQSGSQDSPFLLRAIEQSRISIVVFSEDYPCYTWCLKELVKIVECMETKNQLVFPIFYKVNPYNVREQKKSYRIAFARHDKKFGKDSDEVRKWRSAMSRVANLPGLVAGSGYEYEHLEKVVEMVTRSLSRYDIFISFRGPDTRHSFTGFLYQALSRERFKTFMDAEELKDGDKIPSAITEAIESSRLSIVVLSENYADSSSCLDELDTIMKCMKTKNQLVWPIFYKVEPTTVRNQKNTYHQAMAEHEQKYGRDSSEVSKWRQNLSEVADLKGFLLQRDEYEYKVVEEIVRKAIENDNGRYSHVTSLDLSGMNNGDENELASSSPSTSRNQHTTNNDDEDEDCSSELSVG